MCENPLEYNYDEEWQLTSQHCEHNNNKPTHPMMKLFTFLTALFLIFAAAIVVKSATTSSITPPKPHIRGNNNFDGDSGGERIVAADDAAEQQQLHRALSGCSQEDDTVLAYPMRWSSDKTMDGCEESCLLRVSNCTAWMFDDDNGSCFVSRDSTVLECDDDDEDKPPCDDFITYVCEEEE